jgi:hypothetical protein
MQYTHKLASTLVTNRLAHNHTCIWTCIHSRVGVKPDYLPKTRIAFSWDRDKSLSNKVDGSFRKDLGLGPAKTEEERESLKKLIYKEINLIYHYTPLWSGAYSI